MNNQSNARIENKRAWVRPTLQRIEAGSAESQRSAVGDGSGNQAS
ncbi:MAG: hypothetical protein AVDCRST_MAG91-1216 [uncultured Sphingomonadaceae bacterium]|uniref:Uncharacterized protein n=1 Tax=uncultured Sphingomonadaceae bacterium TaxID=169976 RepID=A0A6J4SS10_9SPHN|nr:MAG: hypothetical protein AVDCRST_MAG91-1216 [uncultured Sphingomonadaceae bacterium]